VRKQRFDSKLRIVSDKPAVGFWDFAARTYAKSDGMGILNRAIVGSAFVKLICRSHEGRFETNRDILIALLKRITSD
jgi:hypothetical protein